ncbi:MAG: Holliday junction resolvase RuvX [bacterium]|nr:Holliday junction resolvase RuvX [bacterium]
MDHSPKMLGLAMSNPDLTIATPHKTLDSGKFTENVKALAPLCCEYNVGGFVIGLPINMAGEENKRSESVRSFAGNLIRAKADLGFDPLIAFMDERLTTFAAEDFMDEQGLSHKQKKQNVDRMAAAYILQAALDIMQKEKQ